MALCVWDGVGCVGCGSGVMFIVNNCSVSELNSPALMFMNTICLYACVWGPEDNLRCHCSSGAKYL